MILWTTRYKQLKDTVIEYIKNKLDETPLIEFHTKDNSSDEFYSLPQTFKVDKHDYFESFSITKAVKINSNNYVLKGVGWKTAVTEEYDFQDLSLGVLTEVADLIHSQSIKK